MNNQLGMLLSGAFEKDLESKLNNQLKKITLDAIKVKVEIDTDNIKKASSATSELTKEKLMALQAINEENLRSQKKVNSTKEEMALNKLLVSNLKTKSQVEAEVAKAQDKATKAKERDGIATTKLNTQMNNLVRRIKNYSDLNKRLEGTTQGNSLQKLMEDIEGNKINLTDATNKFSKIKRSAQEAGLEGRNMWESISGKFFDRVKFLANAAAIEMLRRAFAQMIDVVKEIDSSLVELQKVSDLSGSSLKNFTDGAFEVGKNIGRTGKEVIDATTTFKRAGYDLGQSVELAKSSLLMTNVGDGIRDVTEASSSMISILKGFKGVESNAVVDMINEVDKLAS